ncbi:MAG: hypothetical protein ACI4J1_09005 [Ruminiclostridium sp.]
MKTAEEFYNEIMTSSELKDKLAEASANQSLDEFLKENGVNCDKKQFKEYAFAKAKEDGVLTDEQLEYIAAGAGREDYGPAGKKSSYPTVTMKESNGKPIQWKNSKTGEVFHYECPNCNKWLYKDSVRWYCPECGEGYFWFVNDYIKYDVKGK